MILRWIAAAVLLLFVTADLSALAAEEDLVYGYECKNGRCHKIELSEQNFAKAVSLPVCKLFCGNGLGTIWPLPSGKVVYEEKMMHINPQTVEFIVPSTTSKDASLWDANQQRFKDLLDAKLPPNNEVLQRDGYNLQILVNTATKSKELPSLTLDTDESYSLDIAQMNQSHILANITADNYFGARHAIETLAQLVIYDDIRREMQIAAKVKITDAPTYKWRGVLLDTSRNYYTPKAIKRTLDGMAMVKLNTFHWHITDSHSFPFEVTKQPELYKLGAYGSRKVYTHSDIRDIVEYGRVRGIRVMPEFDAPAHVGEGWQHKNMTACFNAQPWKNYCVEPPCGQLDPSVDDLYPVLEDIYSEMFELFNPDVFHMGGDEVSVNCWNSSERIRNWMTAQGWSLQEADFMRLWGHFQTKALNRVDKIASTKVPITLWTSRLTDVPYIDDYLDKNRYIIQIWTTGMDPKVREILKRGFRIIISNYDALYFDCGGAGWVSDGNNWCSPYIGWQKVYDNKLTDISSNEYHNHVLGAEAAIWSEQIDEHTLDARFWPRASALAERLWSNPSGSWHQAESRMLVHRERLVENNIGAEALQPEWCLQNENECPIDAYDTKF